MGSLKDAYSWDISRVVSFNGGIVLTLKVGYRLFRVPARKCIALFFLHCKCDVSNRSLSYSCFNPLVEKDFKKVVPVPKQRQSNVLGGVDKPQLCVSSKI